MSNNLHSCLVAEARHAIVTLAKLQLMLRIVYSTVIVACR